MKIHLVSTLLLLVSSFSMISVAEAITCNPKQSSYNCLLCNCYHESRGEPFNGMVAVSKVVIARSESNSFPNSICGVVYQPAQFSWTQDSYSNNISDADSGLNECKRAVDVALAEGSNGVLYFYNPKKARPAWARKMTSCGAVGDHSFLTERGTNCPRNLGAQGNSSGSRNSNSNKNEGAR